MFRFALKVDQEIAIGQDIRVSPTDIDAYGVRLVARGRVLGGPNDGNSFESTHELLPGNAVNFGPHVVVTLVEVCSDIARFHVFAPANVTVQAFQ
jgi:sRNA-binding carbon storage regulator CsrA